MRQLNSPRLQMVFIRPVGSFKSNPSQIVEIVQLPNVSTYLRAGP